MRCPRCPVHARGIAGATCCCGSRHGTVRRSLRWGSRGRRPTNGERGGATEEALVLLGLLALGAFAWCASEMLPAAGLLR
jgi:hypothetical protein